MGLAVCQQDLKPQEQGQPGRQLWQTGHQIDQVEITNANYKIFYFRGLK